MAEIMNAAASLLSALVVAVVAIWAILRVGPAVIAAIRDKGGTVSVLGVTVEVEPTKRLTKAGGDEDSPLPGLVAGEPIPADYVYLVHTSFLRDDPDLQKAWQASTGVKEQHYDIRVIVDSYYEDALDQVKYVEYILHEAYPEPVQARSNRDEKFLLKELANGEFVAIAKVHLRGRSQPMILQRYITLSEEGPRIEDYIEDA